jgi:hypothetical protein
MQGEPTPPRTTRIFVARIPPSVTESQFRSYFEAFGKLQDAYMPKDHSKQVWGVASPTLGALHDRGSRRIGLKMSTHTFCQCT